MNVPHASNLPLAASVPTACIIGWPVTHSRSPLIHRYWLRKYGIAGDYVIRPVPPDEIAGFLAGFAGSGFVGANVTVPYKEAAFAAAAERRPAAEAIGAVNTVWLQDGILHGDNTDADGFAVSLDRAVGGWDAQGGHAVVLGAGGAARAIVWALMNRGFDPVTIVNRTIDRAVDLAERFGGAARAAAWDSLSDRLRDARLLVNTTSLGMAGQPPLDIDLSPLPADAIVNDLVYVPLETDLLRKARARGLMAVDGLGMLLCQATIGFWRWFGVMPEVTSELRALVAADLGRV
jgi:shikimate dehydrogenase